MRSRGIFFALLLSASSALASPVAQDGPKPVVAMPSPPTQPDLPKWHGPVPDDSNKEKNCTPWEPCSKNNFNTFSRVCVSPGNPGKITGQVRDIKYGDGHTGAWTKFDPKLGHFPVVFTVSVNGVGITMAGKGTTDPLSVEAPSPQAIGAGSTVNLQYTLSGGQYGQEANTVPEASCFFKLRHLIA
ncbi:hypothetical protein LOZ61_002880 [Ophidiomyces ophidiicola]|nr:hypothetical protein LOZ61_002880 [Ophidiomyces ophidiicola]KAI1931175.1 hypothetical protein LOZ60_000376 [Ophidiomyces ophidiicola]KAI2148797.1 hypothetical protein LOZ27_001322 [Ophidiomyces ophidiicola]KAI2413469.1 hypothetical protein LOY90_001686 [Ophidiomyces ophidiicola]